jgi:hypothetical protein
MNERKNESVLMFHSHLRDKADFILFVNRKKSQLKFKTMVAL